ncbi:MAG: hypothetical protein H6742_20160 [Alphaproteobacteria bacterium]|nr:hypothetical protein [Alphaproteobacteria bacterium]
MSDAQRPEDALSLQIDALVARLRDGDDDAKAALVAACSGADGARARELLENAMKGELLETRWEIEDVLEETTPKKAAPATPEPEPEPEPESDPNRPLTAADLDLVYDDPRGLMLHKSKVGDRWFATQVDPRTGQPQTFELHPQEVQQLKAQLQGSPYWLVGAGA